MERPEFSRRICEELGKRYASVPGIMFYIFDDGCSNTPVQNGSAIGPGTAWKVFPAPVAITWCLRKVTDLRCSDMDCEALTMPANRNYSNLATRRTIAPWTCARQGRAFTLRSSVCLHSGAKASDIDYAQLSRLNVSGSPAGDYSVYLMEPHLFFATGGSFVDQLGLEGYRTPNLPLGRDECQRLHARWRT